MPFLANVITFSEEYKSSEIPKLYFFKMKFYRVLELIQRICLKKAIKLYKRDSLETPPIRIDHRLPTKTDEALSVVSRHREQNSKSSPGVRMEKIWQ